MIDNLRSYLEGTDQAQRANKVREYLQWLILRSLDTHGMRKYLAFVGDTALRIIYGTNRFSEDLDFSMTGRTTEPFSAITAAIQRDLQLVGLNVTVSALHSEKTVWSCFLGFANLLHPLGLAGSTSQKLSIKIEIDTNPPRGEHLEEYFASGPVMFSVNHYDMPSLFAGKLHALLFRKYIKGRDWFHLLFYLSKRTPFNLKLFKNAAGQTHPELSFKTNETVLLRLSHRLDIVDEKAIAADLQPFLLNPEDIRYLTKKNLARALEQNIRAGIFK